MPITTAAALHPSKPAEMISASRKPGITPPALPASDPNSATPSTLPVCRMELSTPEATPERDLSTLPRSVEVSGGTSSPNPAPMAMNCTTIAP